MMKPNLLFVNLPNVPLDYIFRKFTSDTYVNLKISMPLGILYLSSYLKQHNELGQVGILDYAGYFEEAKDFNNIDEFILGMVDRAVNFKPDVVLLSLMFSVSHGFCIRVLENFRKLWPKSLNLVGGVHATNYTDKLLENEHIDYVFRGEAEIALSQFIKQLIDANPSNIKGVYSRYKSERKDTSELCEFVYNLDDIPFPDWDLIDMDKYTRISYVTVTGRKKESEYHKKSSVILGTRGCPGRCTFCSQHTTHGRKIRYRSVDNIIEEMRILNTRFGVTTFVPNDDMFLSKRKRDLALLGATQKLDIPNLEMQFPNGLHVNSMTPEVMDALKAAGTKVVNLAIESGSDYTQKHIIKKYVNLSKAKEVVKYFRKTGIFTHCFFILGFPGETKSLMLQTIEYAKSLQADWCDFFEAIPLIGSEMYEQFKEIGCISEDERDWSKSYFIGRDFDSPEITAKELKDLAYRANLKYNFLFNYNKTSGNYRKAISLFEDITRKYPFHIIAWYAMMECHEKMDNEEKAEEILHKIADLIKANNMALDMFEKYNDLIPKISLLR